MSKEEYRNTLVTAAQKSQDDYDKTIITLSGGALAISVVFIKDIIGNADAVCVWAVVAAWIFWGISIASVVSSYFSSRYALGIAIDQTDKGNYSGGVGGCAAKFTKLANAVSGIFFVLGIAFLIIFTANNLGAKDMSNDRKDTPTEKKGYVPPPPPPSPIKDPRPISITEGIIPPPPPPTKEEK